MSELAFLLTILLVFAGILALIGGYGVAQFFKRRNPALFRPLPSISPATEWMLHSHDSEMPTCAVDLKKAVRQRPLPVQLPRPRGAIGSAPVAPVRSQP